jgi:hypothetical protein
MLRSDHRRGRRPEGPRGAIVDRRAELGGHEHARTRQDVVQSQSDFHLA